MGTTGEAVAWDGVTSNPASIPVQVGDQMSVTAENLPDPIPPIPPEPGRAVVFEASAAGGS